MAGCPAENTLLDFVERRLSEDLEGQIHEHLDECPACLALLADLPAGHSRAAEEPAALARTDPAAGGAIAEPPKEFDEFRLLRPLGRGAMGQVYLGHDALLDRQVAIKFLAQTAAGPQARERFFIEARAVARLSHPNVVAVYQVGEAGGWPYLVSELIRGDSLEKLPRPVPWERALSIGIGLARGLAAAHRCGVLHRDIKPANAIVTHQGEVKLLDFGLAKLQRAILPDGQEISDREVHAASPAEEVSINRAVSSYRGGMEARGAPSRSGQAAGAALPDEGGRAGPPLIVSRAGDLSTALEGGERSLNDAPGLTGAGGALGTPLYMAPEAWRGEPATRRSDLYSLGALLFELCAGRPPFLAPTLAALQRAAKEEDAPPLQGLAPQVDPRLCAVVDRCLRRDPEERFASAEEVGYALEQLTPGARAAVPEGNPYRGLRAFEAEHRGLFFGRGLEIRTLLELLRAQPLVFLAGDSGVGKSSLCRAGVLPLLTEGAMGDGRSWTVVTLVPGRRPLQALADALGPGLADGPDERLALLRGEPAAVPRALRARLGERAGVLLFIDQTEELLSLSEPREAALFAEVLGHLGERVPGVRALLSARVDFLARLAELPGLGSELSRGLYLLRALSHKGLREAIVAPAAAKGISFESEALVEDLLSSTLAAPGGLPLLQFALAELWEAREPERGVIKGTALAAIGGVAGALERHADVVLSHLLPAQRKAAQRILLGLVTRAGTRARRPEAELLTTDPADRAALDALVHGRLLVARQAEGSGALYELAHEALLTGWGLLRNLIEGDAGARLLRQRVSAAAAEWQRHARSGDALWQGRPLKEAAALALDDLAGPEAEFLAASRGAQRRRSLARWAIVCVILAVAPLTYGVVQLSQRRRLERAAATQVREALGALALARQRSAEAARSQKEALTHFDLPGPPWREAAEPRWAAATELLREASAAYARAHGALWRAWLQGGRREEVRRLLGEVMYEEVLLGGERARDQLGLEAIDEDGAIRRRLLQPAALDLRSEPPGAQIALQRYEDQGGRRLLHPAAAPLLPGSYLITLHKDGRPEVRLPLLLGRGERQSLTVPLPPSVPDGLVHVPAGCFLYGSGDDENLRQGLLEAAPQHRACTSAFLIGRTEVTFAEWLAYLRTLPAAERKRRLPAAMDGGGGLQLRESGGLFVLEIQPSRQRYVAGEGEPIRYPERHTRAAPDWRRFPVSGIALEDAQGYLSWLRRSGRLPGARLCDEREWERAARGADDRRFPHGDRLLPDDANFDETYGRREGGFGPDEVGAHPASASPFGVLDLSGNVWEWTQAAHGQGQVVWRGGSFYHAQINNRASCRTAAEPSARSIYVGLRVCADG